MPGLSALLRALLVWVLIALAETAQGSLRRFLFDPELEFVLRQASIITGALIIFNHLGLRPLAARPHHDRRVSGGRALGRTDLRIRDCDWLGAWAELDAHLVGLRSRPRRPHAARAARNGADALGCAAPERPSGPSWPFPHNLLPRPPLIPLKRTSTKARWVDADGVDTVSRQEGADFRIGGRRLAAYADMAGVAFGALDGLVKHLPHAGSACWAKSPRTSRAGRAPRSRR